MIICMFNILCITNRHLCKTDFLSHIEEIAKSCPGAIVLREKDLSEEQYRKLAEDVLEICERHNVECILHKFVRVAIELNCKAVHLPLEILRNLTLEERKAFSTIGASCHSTGDAMEAEILGCTYVTAGHVFDTECKKGIPGRGIEFLKKVCLSVSIPVYAIGGINAENVGEAIEAGAAGVCVMSGIMQCESPEKYFEELVKKHE